MTAMTNLSRYTAAVLPDTYRVLGRWLVPITLGHLLLLIRLRNPLACGGRTMDAADIAQAVLVCSKPQSIVTRTIDRRWQRVRLWWLGLRALWDAPRARAALLAYAASGLARPTLWMSSGDGRQPSGAPYWLGVQITLMRDLGMTWSETLDTPVSVAMWLCAGIWEGNGGCSIASDIEHDVMSAGAQERN